MVVIFPPLLLHVRHRLIQCPGCFPHVVSSSVLVVLILHTEIVRYDDYAVAQQFLENKIRVLFYVGHVIEPAFQALLIEPADSSGNAFEQELRIELPDIACHGTGCEGGAQPETCHTCNGTGYTIKTVRSMFGMMQTQVPCPDCHGEGTIIKNKCKHCGGDGIVKGDEVVEINIPAGVEDGMCVSVRGKGNAGKHNGINGDIQVLIQEEKSDIFERNGQDLYYNLVLDFTTATLGGEVEVPTIDGKTTLKIEPGTQPGKQMRLRGKGLPAVQGYGYGKGDIIVNITVFVPKTLTKEEKALVLKFKECENFKADSATKKSLFESFKNLFK